MCNSCKSIIILLLCIHVFRPLLSQSDSIENSLQTFQEIIVAIAEQSGNENVTDEFADILMELTHRPVSVNSPSREELGKLFWLNEKQIATLYEYINKYGPVKTLAELYYIEGFSASDIKLLMPFVTLKKYEKAQNNSPKSKYHHTYNRLLWRAQRVIEKQDGFIPKETPTGSNHYTGDPWRIYLKYEFQHNKINAGLLAEKDPGEEFFKGSNAKKFDFTSCHIQLNDFKIFKTIILGDYKVNFGQGLVTWTGFNFGKSSPVYSSLKRGATITRYTSTDENNYFRGLATTLQWRQLELTAFYSINKVDGNITLYDTIRNIPMEISSLQRTGIHATKAEITDENACKLKTTGTHITIRNKTFEIGISAMCNQLSCSLNPSPQPYNLYFLRGKSYVNAGMDYKLRLKDVLFFGEGAVSKSKGKAFLNGVQFFGSNKFGLSLIYRYYEKNYHALFSSSFGESADTKNEEGFYAGFECAPIKFVVLSAYMDFFRFPWLKYGTDAPSSGAEYSCQIKISPHERYSINIQYRYNKKEENSGTTESVKNIIVPVTNQKWKANSQFKVNNNIKLQNRLEFSYYRKGHDNLSNGFFIGQDIEFSLKNLPLKFYMRYSIFDTRDYNSRIYSYENDLLYAFSIPTFYNEGSRSYAMIKYSPNRSVDFWIKYSITQYNNKETVGSGLGEIAGNHKSEFKVQALIKF